MAVVHIIRLVVTLSRAFAAQASEGRDFVPVALRTVFDNGIMMQIASLHHAAWQIEVRACRD